MTVSAENYRVEYTATSGQTLFPYPFKVFDDDHLKVYQGGSLLTLDTHYTVSGVGEESGGNVTLVTGATEGDLVVILRDVPLLQTADFVESGAFPVETVEKSMDWLAMGSQTLKEQLARSVKIGAGSQISSVPTFPDPEANTFIMWNASGELVNVSEGISGVDVLAELASQAAGKGISLVKLNQIGYYLPEQYGTVDKTGGDDSTTAFLAALTAAHTGNGTLLVPPGTYKLSSWGSGYATTATKRVQMVGIGKVTLLGVSSPTFLSGVDCIVDIENIRFENWSKVLNFDGSAAGSNSTVRIRRCQFIASAPMDATEAAIGTNLDSIVFEQNYCYGSGISILGRVLAKRISIRENYFTNHSMYGVVLGSSTPYKVGETIIIESNVFKDIQGTETTMYAVSIRNGGHTLVRNNVFDGIKNTSASAAHHLTVVQLEAATGEISFNRFTGCTVAATDASSYHSFIKTIGNNRIGSEPLSYGIDIAHNDTSLTATDLIAGPIYRNIFIGTHETIAHHNHHYIGYDASVSVANVMVYYLYNLVAAKSVAILDNTLVGDEAGSFPWTNTSCGYFVNVMFTTTADIEISRNRVQLVAEGFINFPNSGKTYSDVRICDNMVDGVPADSAVGGFFLGLGSNTFEGFKVTGNVVRLSSISVSSKYWMYGSTCVVYRAYFANNQLIVPVALESSTATRYFPLTQLGVMIASGHIDHVTAAYTYGTDPTMMGTLTLPVTSPETSLLVRATAVGQKSDGSDRAAYDYSGCFYCDGSSLAQSGTTVKAVDIDNTWTAEFAIATRTLQWRLTGVASTFVRWHGRFTIDVQCAS